MSDITNISINGSSYTIKDNTKSVICLNDTWRTGANSAVFYAPTSIGTSGQILLSGGSGAAPYWSTPISVQAAAPLSYTISGNIATIGAMIDEKPIEDSTNLISSGAVYSYCVLSNDISANNPTLSYSNTSTIGAVGGVSLKVTMPEKPTTVYTTNSNSSATRYLVATSSGTGHKSAYIYTNIFCNHNTGLLTATSFNSTSDARLKENITEYKCDNSILDLPVYKYDFIDGAKNQIGCLAQDLQKICPELVTEGDKGYLTISESKIVYLLLQEVKKQAKRIEKLEKALSEGKN